MSKPELKLLPIIGYGDNPEELSGVSVTNGQLFVDLRDGTLKQAQIDESEAITWVDFQAGQGPAGPEGPEGPEGPKGSDGADGQDGQDGADGEPWDPTTLPGYSEEGTLVLEVVDGVLQWVTSE